MSAQVTGHCDNGRIVRIKDHDSSVLTGGGKP